MFPRICVGHAKPGVVGNPSVFSDVEVATELYRFPDKRMGEGSVSAYMADRIHVPLAPVTIFMYTWTMTACVPPFPLHFLY